MDKTISLAQAFAHCAGTASYWEWIIGTLILGIGGFLGIRWFEQKNNKDLGGIELLWIVAFVFALGIAIFSRPTNVAANTTVEEAARGEYLGY